MRVDEAIYTLISAKDEVENGAFLIGNAVMNLGRIPGSDVLDLIEDEREIEAVRETLENIEKAIESLESVIDVLREVEVNMKNAVREI